MRNLIVGLTGGIACGKTTVAGIFRDFGADIIDADLVGHQVLKDDLSVYEKIVNTFGRRVLNDRGEIDRSKLGRIVFDSPDCLRVLNGIVHPPVIERIKAEIERKLSSAKCKIIAVDIVLLIEANLTYMVDAVVVVYADEEVQMQRLMQRGLSQEDAEKRIRSQMSSREKTRFADFVIYNDGSLSDTRKQVKQIWRALTEMICLRD